MKYLVVFIGALLVFASCSKGTKTSGIAVTGHVADKIKTISHGEVVDVGKYFAKDKYMVVEFYADW